MAVLGVGWRLAALVAGVVVGLAALITLADAAYELRLYGSPYGLLDLHRAWTPAGALAVLESWASPPEADLLRAARWFVVWDFVFLVGLATFLAGSVLLVRGPIARAATIPDAQLRTSRTAG